MRDKEQLCIHMTDDSEKQNMVNSNLPLGIQNKIPSTEIKQIFQKENDKDDHNMADEASAALTPDDNKSATTFDRMTGSIKMKKKKDNTGGTVSVVGKLPKMKGQKRFAQSQGEFDTTAEGTNANSGQAQVQELTDREAEIKKLRDKSNEPMQGVTPGPGGHNVSTNVDPHRKINK